MGPESYSGLWWHAILTLGTVCGEWWLQKGHAGVPHWAQVLYLHRAMQSLDLSVHRLDRLLCYRHPGAAAGAADGRYDCRQALVHRQELL